MISSSWQKQFWTVLWLLLCVLTFSGCTQPAPVQTTPEPAAVAPTATLAASPTLLPSPTPQPKVVLVGAADGQNGLPVGVQEMIQKLSQEQGWAFETSPDFASLGEAAGVQLLAVSAQDAGLASFAAAHPQIKILALGAPGIDLPANMALVNLQSGSADQLGFLAGYISAVITKDWRVGVISQVDTPGGKAARQGFVNGVVFYCGLCRPIYPPFFTYPVFTEIAAGAPAEAQQAAAAILISNAVQTAYVAPEIAEEPLLEALAKGGVKLISGRPPSAVTSEQWVTTLQADWTVSLDEAWQRLLSGEGGFQVDAPIRMADSNPQILTTGRQRLVEQILQDLLAGYIDTGVNPLTGEPR